MPPSSMHIPRVRQVDEGEWIAMVHIGPFVAVVWTIVAVLAWCGIWKLASWVWRALS